MPRRDVKRRCVSQAINDQEVYYLLRFIEDSQLQVTKEHLVRNTASGKIIGLWFPNHKWYEAQILDHGAKTAMELHKEQLIREDDLKSTHNLAAEVPDGGENTVVPLLPDKQYTTSNTGNTVFELSSVSGGVEPGPSSSATVGDGPNPAREAGEIDIQDLNRSPLNLHTLQSAQIILTNSNSSPIKRARSRRDVLDHNYKDMCNLDENDFSPYVSEYEPSEDSDSSNELTDSSHAPKTDNQSTSTYVKSNTTSKDLSKDTYCGDKLQSTALYCIQVDLPVANNSNATSNIVNQTIKVELAKKKANGKRKFDKKHCCKYCLKSYQKLPRHLQDIHFEKAEVAEFLALPVGTKERRMKIEAIRLAGEKIHNFKLYSSEKVEGKLIPKRRPTVEKDVKHFLPCQCCGSFLSKSYLARHLRFCKKRQLVSKDSLEDETPFRMVGVQSQSAMLLPSAPKVPEHFKINVLQKMVYDEVYQEILSDKLLISFGQKLYETKFRKPSQSREVKDRMRELARLLIAVKKFSNVVNCLTDLIDPTMYNVILKGAKQIAGYNENTGNYESPSLALKIGQSLKKCASRYKGMCMDDETLHRSIRKTELFIQRMEENWSEDVAVHAHTTLNERRWNAPQRIPLTEDVRKMHKYLMDQEEKCITSLKHEKTAHNFRSLCENTLCRLILLNRRRVGEAQYMRLSDYQKSIINKSTGAGEMLSNLTEVEQLLVKTLLRVEIRGKRGRMVPVILTASIKEAINLLIHTRKYVGVTETNDFLFPAIHASLGHYRADVLLRNVAVKCGAKNPHTLTGTQLRKHIATMVQLLNLRENELDAVASYLGHDIRVHRQYYRLPHDTMQLAKVSKLLINMENGNINSMRGMNLDEIDVEDRIEDTESPLPEDDHNNHINTNVASSHHNKDHSELGFKNSNGIQGAHHSAPATRSDEINKIIKRQKFSPTQSQLIRDYFKRFINMQRVPGINDVNKFQKKYPEMENVEWTRIKFHVYNTFSSKKRIHS